MIKHWMLLILLFYGTSAFAEQKRLAVLEFRGIDVEDKILFLLSDEIRSGILKVVDKQSIKVMTRESTLQILKDNGKDAACFDGECEVEIARNIGARYVVSGTVAKLGDSFIVTIRLHDADEAVLLSSDKVNKKDEVALLESMNPLSLRLMQQAVLTDKRTKPTSDHKPFQSEFSGGDDDWQINQSFEVIVSFTSEPSGSVVMLNGQLLCQATPCQKTVTPGTHQIRIEKERYNGWSKNIDTKKGSIVHGKLTPKFGFLKINTTVSGVELSLDGQSLGKTPIKPIELDAGIHKIEVNDKCYTGPDYRFQTLANKTEEVKYPLKARQSGIKVSLSDHLENALKGQVYVDDVYLGETPSTYQLPLCSKQLIVKYNGQAVEKILSLEEKKVLEFDLQIEEYKDRTLLLGSWSEKWGCDGEETDINYNDQYNITYNNDWEIEAPDYAHYRFADTTFRNGHLSTTLYNENDMSDVFIIQYELNMKNPNRLYGRAQTNKGVDVSICWNRITHK